MADQTKRQVVETASQAEHRDDGSPTATDADAARHWHGAAMRRRTSRLRMAPRERQLHAANDPGFDQHDPKGQLFISSQQTLAGIE